MHDDFTMFLIDMVVTTSSSTPLREGYTASTDPVPLIGESRLWVPDASPRRRCLLRVPRRPEPQDQLVVAGERL